MLKLIVILAIVKHGFATPAAMYQPKLGEKVVPIEKFLYIEKLQPKATRGNPQQNHQVKPELKERITNVVSSLDSTSEEEILTNVDHRSFRNKRIGKYDVNKAPSPGNSLAPLNIPWTHNPTPNGGNPYQDQGNAVETKHEKQESTILPTALKELIAAIEKLIVAVENKDNVNDKITTNDKINAEILSYSGRVKRDVSVPETKSSNATTEASVNKDVAQGNETVQAKSAEGAATNDTAPSAPLCTPPTRRSFEMRSSPEIRDKILNYLNVTYGEIMAKIIPIAQIKEQFAKDNLYKIGYITANVDSLQANIINLKRNLDQNKNDWEDSQILDLFDKLIQSNKVVSKLIETLASYSKDANVVTQLGNVSPNFAFEDASK